MIITVNDDDDDDDKFIDIGKNSETKISILTHMTSSQILLHQIVVANQYNTQQQQQQRQPEIKRKRQNQMFLFLCV